MGDQDLNQQDSMNTGWLDETGSLPDLEPESEKQPGGENMPDAVRKADHADGKAECQENDNIGKAPDPSDDWDFDENGMPLHPDETEDKPTEADCLDAVSGEKKRRRRGKVLLTAAGGLLAIAAVCSGISYGNGLKEIEAQRLGIRGVGGGLTYISTDADGVIQNIADFRTEAEKEEEAKLQEEEKKEKQEREREEQLEEEKGTVPVELSLSTIQSDLKVKIRNANTRSLIGDVPFRIKVTAPSGKTAEYEDDDEDGIIYKAGLASGKYQVELEPLIDLKKIQKDSEKEGTDYHDNEDYILYSKFAVSGDPQSIEVTDRIAYEVVDVKDEVKSASEVNTAQEDTAHNDTAVEGTLQNTVAFVDSSRTEITDSSATDPAAQAAATAGTGTEQTAAAAETGKEQAATAESTAAQTAQNAGSAAAAASSDQTVNAAAAAAGTEPAETGTEENAAAGAASTVSPESAEASESGGEKQTGYKYTGWQTIDGRTYYFDANGIYVTGTQVIEGITYTFGDDGALDTAASRTGIDVSQWNGTVDWNSVAASGISFAVVRCGYRGSSQGMLVLDPLAGTNIAGARNAGLKVGLYFFSQAVNEAEAVEEASVAVQVANTYGITMPIYLDVETSGGRGDAVSVAQRTANIAAFCQTVVNAGYSAGVYANTSWLTEKINAPALAGYNIWLAQYAAAPTYSATAFHMWQYTSTGHVNGIRGNVDLNILY